MTATRPLILATRTRKARRTSWCALCPAAVSTGQRIGLISAGWSHVRCIVAANRAAYERGQLPPDRPAERSTGLRHGELNRAPDV